MTFRPGTLFRSAFAAVFVAVLCLAAPVARASAQVAPDTTIDMGPPGLVTNGIATFEFSSSDQAATFQCWHHPDVEPPPTADFAACSSPWTLTGVADGDWVFEVRAVDAANNPDPTPATFDFSVDAAPDTTIDGGPTKPSTDGSAVFTFSSADATGFLCRHHPDGQTPPPPDFAACSSPWALTGVADGNWVFEVIAVDAAGTPDPEPARRSFSVDTTAPDTMIVSGPNALSNDATPEFAFTSTEAGSFGCRLHRVGEAPGGFAPCGSLYAPGQLADGAYVLEVMAVDAADNPDDTPASFGFEIDTTAPETTISGGPGDTTAATAVFLFSAPGAASFLCRLDGAAWEPCGSPRTYSPLGLGPHQFEVMAVDAAGNQDPSPASHAWQVLRPGLVIPGAVEQATALAKELVQMRRALARIRLRTLARRRTVLFRTYDALTAGTVEVRARARVRQGGRRRWIRVLAGERDVPGAGRHRIRAKVTKKARRLARGRKTLPLELRLSFTDRAGRSLWATTKLTLKR